jgi:hypothetical protein
MLSSFGDGGSLPTLDPNAVPVALIASAAHMASETPATGDRRRHSKLLPASVLRRCRRAWRLQLAGRHDESDNAGSQRARSQAADGDSPLAVIRSRNSGSSSPDDHGG